MNQLSLQVAQDENKELREKIVDKMAYAILKIELGYTPDRILAADRHCYTKAVACYDIMMENLLTVYESIQEKYPEGN